MIHELYCLMVRQVSLNKRMRNSLIVTAAEILRRHDGEDADREPVRDDDMEGVVMTRFRIACIGSIAGIAFSAEVETSLGRGRVEFIIDPRTGFAEDEEIMAGQWSDVTENFRRARTAPLN